jgi:hypothetical protein
VLNWSTNTAEALWDNEIRIGNNCIEIINANDVAKDDRDGDRV